MFLASYTSTHSTVQNPCAQRSRISLTPICIIHFTVYYGSIWTSGRQRVDCVTLGAKCMLYAYQNKGSMHSACSRSNRQVICMFHVLSDNMFDAC